MNKIEFNTHIKAPIDRCFDLARSIEFHKVSVEPIKEISVAGCTKGLIGPNQHTLFQSKFWGLRFSTELKLKKFTPPFFMSFDIVDSNFESIIHDYYFYDISEETVMVNHFYYKPKWGVIGEVLDFLFLEKLLTHILTKRNELFRNYAESTKWQDILPARKHEYQSFVEK